MHDGALTQSDISDDNVNSDPPRALTLAAHQMSELIEQGELSIPAMRAIMWNTHGGSDADGAWDWRAAYDCAETGLLLALKRDPELDLSSHEAVLGQITRAEDLLVSMPTQTRRSEDQMRMQQFSTPVPLALLMVAAAYLEQGAYASSRPCSKQKGEIAEKEETGGSRGAPSPTDLTTAPVAPLTVLEPSAGCGALAMLAQKAGCVTFANELDPRRRALCAQVLDQDVSGLDAEFIANADFAQDVDRVLINPPFSSSKARAGDTTIALRHAISAMACLKDGGRMVAILPEGAFGPRQSKWLSKLLDQARVRLHIALPRPAFAKSGTSIPTRLLVLDKDCGPSAFPTCHHVDSMAEAAQRIANLAPAPLASTAAGQMTRQQSAAPAATSPTPPQASAQAPVKSPPSPQPQSSSLAISVRSRNEGKYGAAIAVEPEARGSEQGDAQVWNGPSAIQPRPKLLPGAARKMPGKAVASTSTGTETAESAIAALSYQLRGDGAIAPESNVEEAASPETATQAGAQNTATAGIQDDGRETTATTDPAATEDAAQISDSFASWSCRRIDIKDAEPHPSDLVESVAMASVALPAPKLADDLNIALAKRTVTEGALSEAQLETLIMAETASYDGCPAEH
jgi:predicted RNA methylase